MVAMILETVNQYKSSSLEVSKTITYSSEFFELMQTVLMR